MTRRIGFTAIGGLALVSVMALVIVSRPTETTAVGVAAPLPDWPALELVYRDDMSPLSLADPPTTSVWRVTYRSQYSWSMETLESSLEPREVGSTRTFENGVFTQHFTSADLTTTDQVPEGVSVAPDRWLSSKNPSKLAMDGFPKRAQSGDRVTYARTEFVPCASMPLGPAPPACQSADSVEQVETYVYLTTITPLFPVEYAMVVGDTTVRHITVASLVVTVNGAQQDLLQ